MTMLQEIFFAALPPEVAFFPQEPQPACQGTLPPRSMGDAVEYLGRQAWTECVQSTGRHLQAHPGQELSSSACVPGTQHKVSLR